MPLYNLTREYEERRAALIAQLQANPNMDAATQHQIYGAIKEIENFLKSIEYRIAQGQEQQMSIELSRDRPSPIAERTKNFASKIKQGTSRVVKERIPNAARKIVLGPKTYFEKRREKAKMRTEVEREMLARMQHDAAASGQLPQDVHTTAQQELQQEPVQELPKVEQEAVPSELEPMHSSTAGDPLHEPSHEIEPRERVGHKRVRKPKLRAPKRPAKGTRPAPQKVVKTHPGKNSSTNKGGQHKPHHKGKRFSRK